MTLLAMTLVCSTSMTSFAASSSHVTLQVQSDDGGGDGGDGGGDGDPDIVKVEIPSDIPLVMNAKDGSVTVASNLGIKNLDDTQNVQVTGITMESSDGWTVVDYDTDLSAKPANTHELGMSFRGDKTQDGGEVAISEDKWVINANSTLPLDVAAKMPLQDDGVYADRKNIATVNWTIKATDTDKPSTDTSTIANDWDAESDMLVSSEKNVTFNWESTKSDASIAKVESADPNVATITEVAAKNTENATYNGQKQYTVSGVSKGKTTITATMDTGETSSFDVTIAEVKSDGTVDITLPDTGLQPGDDLNNGNITVDIPVSTPDGDDVITIKPEFPSDIELKPGDNEIELDVDVNGATIHIKITITIKVDNPSDGLSQSIEEAKAMGFTFSSYEDGLKIDSFENKQFKKEINIPEQIGDFKVLKISDNVFKDQTNIAKVTMPPSVKEIGNTVFAGCSNLSEIQFAEGLTSIGDGVFSNCVKLSTVTFPNSLSALSTNAFSGCTGLTSVNFASVSTIGDSAFSGCTGLTSVEFASVKTIGNNAFSDCTGLTSIELASVSTIGDSAFSGCTGLTSVVFPESIKNTGNQSFSGCTGIKSIDLNTVNTIDTGSFRGCTGLTSITFPKSIEYINANAFNGCTGLTELEIPETVKKLEDSSFEACTGLQHVSILGTETLLSKKPFLNAGAEDSVIEFNQASCVGAAYSNFANAILSPNVTEIGVSCFERNNVISEKTITGGENVLKIGNNAFKLCVGVTDIPFKDTITYLGNNSFTGTGLKSISLCEDQLSSLKYIGKQAFSKCESLERVSIGDKVEGVTFGHGLFYGSGSPTATLYVYSDVVTPDASYDIGTFEDSTFASVVLGEEFDECWGRVFKQASFDAIEFQCPTFSYFGTESFYNCDAPAVFTLPPTTTRIRSKAFASIYSTEVRVPRSAQLDSGAFGTITKYTYYN